MILTARESKIISFDWTIPNSATIFPRVYIVLDPTDQIDEIHETNNIGWKVLPLSDISTYVIGKKQNLVTFELSQNYPNPFNPSTKISYSLPTKSKVKLQIFNILGQLVATLVDKTKSAGFYQLEWNAGNLASGVYLYRINAESVGDAKQFNSIRKLILLK